MDETEDIQRNIGDAEQIVLRTYVQRCMVAFLIGYLLGESNVSITGLFL
jgi:hypothetical protein